MRKDEFPIVHEYCRQETIKELEKVKAEMKKVARLNEFEIITDKVMQVLDKHIEELKGENK